MKVWINGQTRQLADGVTVAALLSELGLEPHRVAVERNKSIVPRARYAEQTLGSGDRIEIVHLVGGG